MGRGDQSIVHVQVGCAADMLSGLSDNYPLVIENPAKQIIDALLDGDAGVVNLSIDKYGIGRWVVAKFAAKKLMKVHPIDVLILVRVIGRICLKKVQMQIAKKLQIPSPAYDSNSDDDEREDDSVDTDLTSRIHASLVKKNFFLIWECGPYRRNLKRLGIPSIRADYFSRVVLLTNATEYAIHIFPTWASYVNPTECWDLLCAHVLDITFSHNSRGDINDSFLNSLSVEIFTANIIMNCIKYFSLFDGIGISKKDLLRCWLGEGFIELSLSDLSSCFKVGEALLHSLMVHELVKYYSKYGNAEKFSLEDNLVEGITRHGVNGEFLKVPYDDVGEISHLKNLKKLSYAPPTWQYAEFPSILPKCPNLSTLCVTDIPSFKGFPEEFFKHTKNLCVLNLWNTGISFLPSSSAYLRNTLKMLNLSGCKRIDPLKLPGTIRALTKLEFLDLSETNFTEMPKEVFEGLHNLRLLDLSNSIYLYSLPSSVSCLQNLEHLLLGGCIQLKCLPLLMPNLQKLDVLDLSNTMLTEIPNYFFHNTKKLRVLNLGSCTRLRSINPSFRDVPSSLIELDISNCTSLENFKDISSSLGDTFPNLEVLQCSGVQLNVGFSVRGCPNLNTITLGGNINVEMVEIVGSKVTKFPLERCSVLPHLRRLYLLGMKHVHIDWEGVHWLPPEVNWDQCSDGKTSFMSYLQSEKLKVKNSNGEEVGVYMSVENANFFRTLKASSPLWERYLSHFYIYICPSNERLNGKRTRTIPKRRFLYNDFYTRSMTPVPSYSRRLEIEGCEKFPLEISGVLSHTQIFVLYNEKSIKAVSDFGIGTMEELKECWIEKCYAMDVVFQVNETDLDKHQRILGCLEKLRISDLMKLTNVCISKTPLERKSFGHLKEMHLEYCPRLVSVFSEGVCLQNLELVEIKFCCRLQEVFSGKGYNMKRSFKKLKTLRLLELSALRSVIDEVVYMPALRKIEVKGCPKLCKLPLQINKVKSNSRSSSLHPILNNVAPVEVKGELEWWNKLEWVDNNVKDRICFKDWLPFKLSARA